MGSFFFYLNQSLTFEISVALIIPGLGFTTGDLTTPKTKLPSSLHDILYSHVGHENSIKRPQKYKVCF